jgi:branched-chain amino acid transport system substrate-binding protein
LDRPAVIKALGSNTFATIIGPLKFENHFLVGGWTVGQWQCDTFSGVSPKQPGAKDMVAKPAWKS